MKLTFNEEAVYRLYDILDQLRKDKNQHLPTVYIVIDAGPDKDGNLVDRCTVTDEHDNSINHYFPNDSWWIDK